MLNTSTDSIRFYERQGLLKPAQKSDLGYRLYDEPALRRLAFIKQAQRCGFSLGEIAAVLKARDGGSARCDYMRELAVRKRSVLEKNMEALKAALQTLDALIEACPGDQAPIERCPIVIGLERLPEPQRG